jgi:IstB-like ATP binding protein
MRYARCVDLLDDLHAGLADGSYARRLKAWARPELLIVDDVGLGQVNPPSPPTSRAGGRAGARGAPQVHPPSCGRAGACDARTAWCASH